MISISFTDELRYDFVMRLLAPPRASTLGVKPRTNTMEMDVQRPVVARLLERLRDNRPVIFPFQEKASYSWIILAPTRHQLDILLTRISRFLVPTYAAFTSESNQPALRVFNPEKSGLQQIGAQLYPSGYYNLRAPLDLYENILSQVEQWLNLEEEKPDITQEHSITYISLYNAFQTAVSATNWTEAERCLYEMQKEYLLTADNLAFLQIQLLSQQQRWLDIWQHPDFSNLSRIRLPKAVRVALLTAFYVSVLLIEEEQGTWEKALETFQQNRDRLGMLLTGRFGLTQAPVVHIFAYQATLDGDLESLHQLGTIAGSDHTVYCLNYLKQLVMNQQGEIKEEEDAALQTQYATLGPLDMAKRALIDRNYDESLFFAREISSTVDKAVLLVNIAYESCDAQLSEEALLTYWELPEDERSHLESQYKYLPFSIKALGNLTSSGAPAEQELEIISSPDSITTWFYWFDALNAAEDRYRVLQALDNVELRNFDSNSWTEASLAQLYNKLFEFLFDVRFSSLRQYQKQVLTYFVNHFLQDSNFPNINEKYTDIYEILYEGLLDKQDMNENTGSHLLRLAEALLKKSPLDCEKIFEALNRWCKKLIPTFEGWILETFDLLAEYGLAPSHLFNWYREWLSMLLNLPGTRERANLEIWQQFGLWIQPGSDLLDQLEAALTKANQIETNDVIAELPAGYRIGIFTLRRSSAQRVQKILHARNSELDIRICTEEDMSEQVRSLVQNVQMVVIVTTCITHAITYGLTPHLKEVFPVYPQASGSSSILRAIEQRARDVVR